MDWKGDWRKEIACMQSKISLLLLMMKGSGDDQQRSGLILNGWVGRSGSWYIWRIPGLQTQPYGWSGKDIGHGHWTTCYIYWMPLNPLEDCIRGLWSTWNSGNGPTISVGNVSITCELLIWHTVAHTLSFLRANANNVHSILYVL